jgi:hypothetical protein
MSALDDPMRVSEILRILAEMSEEEKLAMLAEVRLRIAAEALVTDKPAPIERRAPH